MKERKKKKKISRNNCLSDIKKYNLINEIERLRVCSRSTAKLIARRGLKFGTLGNHVPKGIHLKAKLLVNFQLIKKKKIFLGVFKKMFDLRRVNKHSNLIHGYANNKLY